MSVTITVDTKQFREFTKVFPGQTAFAASKAINTTALQAQKAVRANLPKKFTIRRKSFAERSIKMQKFAKKRDLEAILQVISKGATPEIFSQHEEGGIKRARDNRRVAIPQEVVTNRRRVIPKSKRPPQLKRSFTITSKKGTDLLIQRKGRKKSSRTSIAYSLEPQVRIRPTLGFEKTVVGLTERRWPTNFLLAFEKAIATRR